MPRSADSFGSFLGIRRRPLVTIAMVPALVLSSMGAGGSASGATSDPPPSAVDVSSDAGPYQVTRTWSANVADVNGDGWKDVLLVRHGDQASQLFVNHRGRFAEAYAGNFIPRDRHDCAWGDVNRDGLPDAYCSIGGDSGGGTGKKELWIQHRDGPFTNEAHAYGVEDPYGRGRRSTFIDVNHDAYPDLFAGSAYPRTDGRLSPNRLWINRGGTSFRDAVEYGLDLEVGAVCAYAVDYNRDGWQDLLVCGQEAIHLYRNDGGRHFTDVTARVGIARESQVAFPVDLNRDGHLDLAQVAWSTVSVQLWSGKRYARPVVVASGFSGGRWITAGDADGDRDADLYVVRTCPSDLSTNYPDFLFMNNGTGTRFASKTIPQASGGCGDNAEPIDYNRDGRTEFLVLNGILQSKDHRVQPRGPIQLIALVDPARVRAADYAFSPGTASAHRGAQVRWIFKGPHNHTASDATQMGLFDSPRTSAGGTYSVRLTVAGTYAYRCAIHPSMTGRIRVPMGAAPSRGDERTRFAIHWGSAAPPPGFVVDIQLKRPGSNYWFAWKTAFRHAWAGFTADAGAGDYQFRARLRKTENGARSGWSVPVSITVV
jgi:hypothetical protein